jgi:hypothetical protein
MTGLTNMIMTGVRDKKVSKRLSVGFYVLLGINIVQFIALTVLLFIFYGATNAIVALGIAFLFFYIGLQTLVKVKGNNKPIKISEKVAISDYVMDQIWKWCNIIIVLALFIILLIYEINQDQTDPFQVFTYWTTVISAILVALIAVTFLADNLDFEDSPVFHSPWLLPVYRYDQEINDVKPHRIPSSFLISFVLLLLAWSLAATSQLRPVWVGIACSCAAEVIFTIAAIFLINRTNIEFKKVRQYVDNVVVKHAWLNSKENLVEMLNLGCRRDFITYEDWWRRRYQLRSYIRAKRGKEPLSMPMTPEFKV